MVREVRSFNRIVTQRVGALQESFLARGRPLGASRLLWEIGGGLDDVRALRERLELDSGYVSRLLRSLQNEGLVKVTPDPQDRRARLVQLTPAGVQERRMLDQRSDDLAQALLDPLSESQRRRLVEAMGVVERLLTAGLVSVAVEDPASPDARACIAAYFEEIGERFEHGFDASASTLPDASALDVFLVARLHGEPVGCGGLKFTSPGVADIKRMWVSKTVRGLGVGRRMLHELESHAHGVTEIRLETNRALTEAIALYRSAGYEECAPFNDEVHSQHWFTKPLAPAR